MWGIDSPAHLGSGRSEEAGQREQAAAALAACGGGAVSCEERRWWPGRLGCGGAAPVGAFYSRCRSVGGGPWPVAAAWSPGELRGLH